MKRTIFLFLLPLLFVLGIVRTAKADGEPVQGRDFWILPQAQCDSGTCVRIAPGININTPLLAEKLGVKPIDIRRDNPTGTIALCHRVGDGYHMGRIARVEDRASDEVWKKCPDPALQYVYVLPGQVIKLSGVKHISYQEEMQGLSDIKKCTTSDCVTEVARRLGAKISGAAVSATPVHGSDPIVAELTACTTADCAVAVAKKAGAPIVVAPPSEGDKLLSELRSCGENDACRNAALQARGLMPLKTAVPPQAPTVAATEDSAGLRSLFAWVLALGFAAIVLAIACLVVALIWRARFAALKAKFDEKVEAALSVLKEGFEKELASVAECRDRLSKKLDEETAEKKGLAEKFQKVYGAIREFGGKHKVPLPQNLTLMESWHLVEQHFAGVAAESVKIGRANEELSQLNQTVAAERRELEEKAGKAAEFERLFNSQVAANETLGNTVVKVQADLGVAKSSLDDVQRNKERCRQLFGIVNSKAAELIAMDNELTELHEPHEEKVGLFRALEATGDSRAEEVKTEILSIEQRIVDLCGRRDGLETELEPLSQELDSLHEQLTGFRIDESRLYKEAQRDRNDAAKELGEAKAVKTLARAQAEAERRAIEADRRQLDSEFAARETEAENKAQELAERECALLAKRDEFAEREIKLVDREAACKHLLLPLLQALDIDQKTTLAQLKEMGGVEGLMQRHAAAYEKLRASYFELKKRFEQLEAGQASAPVPSPDASQNEMLRLAVLLEDRDNSIREKDARIVSLTNELDLAKQAGTDCLDTIAKLEQRVSELEPYELAAKGSFKPSPVPRELAASDEQPLITVQLQEEVAEEPVPTSITRQTVAYTQKPLDRNRAPSGAGEPADGLVIDKFFDLADQLVKSGRKILVDSTAKVRTLQLLLTEVPVEFDFDRLFKNGSPFSADATRLIHTRGEDFVRSRLASSRSLLIGIQWFLDACGIPEMGPPQTNRAWSPG